MDLIQHIFTHYYGEKEIPGPQSNPVILKIIRKYTPWIQNDGDIAWCAIFMSHILDELAYPLPKPILAARQFLDVGTPVTEPKPGDLVIYWRGSREGWKGHVGIYVRRVGEVIYTLGGNQGNAITISEYSAARLLGFRRL